MSSPTATHPRRAAGSAGSRRPATIDADAPGDFLSTEPGRLAGPAEGWASWSAVSSGETLGRYENGESDEHREIIAVSVRAGGVLVVDCRTSDRSDPRLLAHITADEPTGNARLVAELYLADAHRGACRGVTLEDLTGAPAPESPSDDPQLSDRADTARLGDFHIHVPVDSAAYGQVRWVQGGSGDRAGSPVTLRDVVASVQAYEPATQMTVAAIRAHPLGCGVSTTTLRMELARVQSSRVVLNRGLREAVERALASGVSMSEIASRCGRTKRGCRGNVSGETSWLARRIGRMPEAGQSQPTPWVHSSTLALIARRGLALSPQEVEL